ncbi:MAG: glycine cleavage system aminomethyltransferase GcvT, partial [Cyanobacteria bacterium P01_G01_bin.19]
MADSQSLDLLRTPLYELAKAQKARFTPFSGWEMPVQFQGLKLEHQAVRSDVGMFDISHMGKFTFEGKGIIDAWQKLVPSDLNRLQPGEAMYTVLLNEQGGIIDDIIFYLENKQEPIQQAIVIVNAGTTDKDKAWILNHLESGITMNDISQKQALIALQGAKAENILQSLVTE